MTGVKGHKDKDINGGVCMFCNTYGGEAFVVLHIKSRGGGG